MCNPLARIYRLKHPVGKCEPSGEFSYDVLLDDCRKAKASLVLIPFQRQSQQQAPALIQQNPRAVLLFKKQRIAFDVARHTFCLVKELRGTE